MKYEKLLLTGATFPIQPADIPTDRHFFNAFGNMETETSALWLVRLAQQRGRGWDPLTSDEIEAFYRAAEAH